MVKKVSGAASPLKGWPPMPFLMVDTASISSTKVLVLGRSALAWVAVEFSPYDYVRELIIHDRHASLEQARGKRFHPANKAAGWASGQNPYLDAVRKQALEHGATPEAIRLIDGVEPFTVKEVSDMADKLAKKTEKPKAEKPAKVAKAAKAAATDKPKRAGNPEALAKARAARAEAGPDTRKITNVAKENPYREGSGRAEAFAALKGAKTVEDYIANGGKKKYIARWAEEGLITVSAK